MKGKNQIYLGLELIWWAITVAIMAGILWPIRANIPGFPFIRMNALFIIVFITLTRYTFLLPYTFLTHLQWLKVVLVFVSIPAVFLLIQEVNFFQIFLDERGPGALVGASHYEEQQKWITYVRTEYLLFGVGSVIAGVLFPVRLLVSVWRRRNLGRE